MLFETNFCEETDDWKHEQIVLKNETNKVLKTGATLLYAWCTAAMHEWPSKLTRCSEVASTWSTKNTNIVNEWASIAEDKSFQRYSSNLGYRLFKIHIASYYYHITT